MVAKKASSPAGNRLGPDAQDLPIWAHTTFASTLLTDVPHPVFFPKPIESITQTRRRRSSPDIAQPLFRLLGEERTRATTRNAHG
jgi:hypothetical protein